MRIPFRRAPEAPSKAQVLRPALASPNQALAAASDAVSRAHLVHKIESLPLGSYAILVTVTPDDEGVYLESAHHPMTADSAAYHGVYNYAADFLANKIRGHFE